MKVVEKVVEMVYAAGAISSLIIGIFNADGPILCASGLFFVAAEIMALRRK